MLDRSSGRVRTATTELHVETINGSSFGGCFSLTQLGTQENIQHFALTVDSLAEYRIQRGQQLAKHLLCARCLHLIPLILPV